MRNIERNYSINRNFVGSSADDHRAACMRILKMFIHHIIHHRLIPRLVGAAVAGGLTVHHISPALCVAAILLLSGCNDEVFVKPLPEIAPVCLVPSGEHVDIDLGVKGAICMNVFSNNSFSGQIYKLDGDGNIIYSGDPTIYLPGGIAINGTGNPNVDLKIMATPEGHVSIDLGHCYSTEKSGMEIVIDYPYGSVEIPLTVEAIKPFRATDIAYTSGFTTLPDDEITDGYSIVIENFSQDTLPAVITPFQGAYANLYFHPDNDGVTALPLAADTPSLLLPSWGDDGAGLYDFRAPYIPGKKFSADVTGLPDVKVRVKVPPMTKRRYQCFIEQKVICADYRLTLESPSIPEAVVSCGTVRVAYPFDYVIGYNDL